MMVLSFFAVVTKKNFRELPNFSPVLCRDIEHSLSRNTTFTTGIVVSIEWYGVRPISHDCHWSSDKDDTLPNITLCAISWKFLKNGLNWPANHVWNSWSNWFYLRCKLIPLGQIAICIRKISNVDDHVNVLQVIDDLFGGIQGGLLVVTILIWTIYLCLY